MRISYEVFVRAAAVLGVALEGGCHEADDSAAVPRAIESLPGEPGEPTRGPCGARLACGAACVDPTVDAANCGGCGIACGEAQACVAGSCVRACPIGQVECEGACRELPLALAGAEVGAREYGFTGAPQAFVVPTCVDRITVELWGAQGGPSECGEEAKFGLPDVQDDGGRGGYVQVELAVVPGTQMYVFVGGGGGLEGEPGWNGGGPGGAWAGGGGGASDVRVGGPTLADRVAVAGGGGGGQCGFPDHGAGGAGGGLVGEPGLIGQPEWDAGGGGSQVEGGAAGSAPGEPGGFGRGGGPADYHVAGGGGGWYGGGGAYAAGGGGGSSYLGAAEGTSAAGVRLGDGAVRISW